MLKKSTLLFVATFFLLFIGLNSYSYGKGKPDPKPPKEDATYSVTISGAVSAESTQDWQNSARKGIGYSDPHDFLGKFTDMSFFITPMAEGGPFTGTSGEGCFGNNGNPLNWRGGTIRQRKGGAEGSFWFDGWTEDGMTAVIYEFKVFGPLVDPWPPTDTTPTTTLEMTHWEMGISNGQSELINTSCIGEGSFVEYDHIKETMTIVGTRTSP